MDQASPQIIRLQDYESFPFAIDQVDLTFDLGEDTTLVTSNLAITRLQADAPLFLHGEDLELVSIKADGKAIDDQVRHVGDGIEIDGLGD